MSAETKDLEICACVCGCSAPAAYAWLRLCVDCADSDQGDRRRALPENYPENHIQTDASAEMGDARLDKSSP